MSSNKILKEEAPEIPDFILRLQSQAKAKHMSKNKLIKDIQNVRKQLYMDRLVMIKFFQPNWQK